MTCDMTWTSSTRWDLVGLDSEFMGISKAESRRSVCVSHSEHDLNVVENMLYLSLQTLLKHVFNTFFGQSPPQFSKM